MKSLQLNSYSSILNFLIQATRQSSKQQHALKHIHVHLRFYGESRPFPLSKPSLMTTITQPSPPLSALCGWGLINHIVVNKSKRDLWTLHLHNEISGLKKGDFSPPHNRVLTLTCLQESMPCVRRKKVNIRFREWCRCYYDQGFWEWCS